MFRLLADFELFVGNAVQRLQTLAGVFTRLADHVRLLFDQPVELLNLLFQLFHRLILVGDFFGLLPLLFLFLLQALNGLLPFLQHLHLFLFRESLVLLIDQQLDQFVQGDNHLFEFAAGCGELILVQKLGHFRHLLGQQSFFGLLVSGHQSLRTLWFFLLQLESDGGETGLKFGHFSLDQPLLLPELSPLCSRIILLGKKR